MMEPELSMPDECLERGRASGEKETEEREKGK